MSNVRTSVAVIGYFALCLFGLAAAVIFALGLKPGIETLTTAVGKLLAGA